MVKESDYGTDFQQNRITVTGTANLILCDGGGLNAYEGITVAQGATLNIYAQSAGDDKGYLYACNWSSADPTPIQGPYNTNNYTHGDPNNWAAIGGGNGAGGTVEIYGGAVEAYGGNYGAGIGGGTNKTVGDGGAVSIYGGIVKSTGGDGADGIGPGGYLGPSVPSVGTLTLGSGRYLYAGETSTSTRFYGPMSSGEYPRSTYMEVNDTKPTMNFRVRVVDPDTDDSDYYTIQNVSLLSTFDNLNESIREEANIDPIRLKIDVNPPSVYEDDLPEGEYFCRSSWPLYKGYFELAWDNETWMEIPGTYGVTAQIAKAIVIDGDETMWPDYLDSTPNYWKIRHDPQAAGRCNIG